MLSKKFVILAHTNLHKFAFAKLKFPQTVHCSVYFTLTSKLDLLFSTVLYWQQPGANLCSR